MDCVQKELIDLVAGVLGVPTESLTHESGPLSVPEWDSLAHLTVMTAVESTFGVELSMVQILGAQSISDLLTLVEDAKAG